MPIHFSYLVNAIEFHSFNFGPIFVSNAIFISFGLSHFLWCVFFDLFDSELGFSAKAETAAKNLEHYWVSNLSAECCYYLLLELLSSKLIVSDHNYACFAASHRYCRRQECLRNEIWLKIYPFHIQSASNAGRDLKAISLCPSFHLKPSCNGSTFVFLITTFAMKENVAPCCSVATYYLDLAS